MPALQIPWGSTSATSGSCSRWLSVQRSLVALWYLCLWMYFLFICNLNNEAPKYLLIYAVPFWSKRSQILFWFTWYDCATTSTESKLPTQPLADLDRFWCIVLKYLHVWTQERSGAYEAQTRWQKPGIIILSLLISVKLIEKKGRKRVVIFLINAWLLFWYSWWLL